MLEHEKSKIRMDGIQLLHVVVLLKKWGVRLPSCVGNDRVQSGVAGRP